MILHYFKNKQKKNEQLADLIYIDLINNLKSIYKYKNQPQNFDLVFEITTILIFSIFYLSKNENNKYIKDTNQKIINLFTQDLHHSLFEMGIGDMKIGKYVRKYIKKFYFRLSKLDNIFLSNDIDEFDKYLKKFNISLNNTIFTDVKAFFLFLDLYKDRIKKTFFIMNID